MCCDELMFNLHQHTWWMKRDAHPWYTWHTCSSILFLFALLQKGTKYANAATSSWRRCGLQKVEQGCTLNMPLRRFAMPINVPRLGAKVCVNKSPWPCNDWSRLDFWCGWAGGNFEVTEVCNLTVLEFQLTRYLVLKVNSLSRLWEKNQSNNPTDLLRNIKLFLEIPTFQHFQSFLGMIRRPKRQC